MDETLRELAATQGGAFTHAQAVAAGCTAGQIRQRLKGDWLAPYRGVYVERSAMPKDPARRHVVHAAARLLASRLQPVASHRTAALVHGLPLLGAPPKVPQLTRAPQRPRDRSSSATIKVCPLPSCDTTSVGGIGVTSLARTSCDVARTSTFRQGVVVADAALRRGVPREELLRCAGRCRAWPRGADAVRVAAFADARADGPLESITRVAYCEQGLPAPETQVEVRAPDGTFLGLVDFLWRERRVVGEADGLGKYDAALALQKEKLREEALRSYGLEVVRNVWDDVWTPGARAALAARVRQAFAFAADKPPVPGVRFRTPSLQELLLAEWDRPY